MKIGLLSDTHGHMDAGIINVLTHCDEIWHAGDVGHESVLDQLHALDKTMRVVYGNIDGKPIRSRSEKELTFACDGVMVYMIHIGGYPPRYRPEVREHLMSHSIDLYICGHSHILKVMPDRDLQLLHMNPGACGYDGGHLNRTLLTFHISSGKIKDVQVVDFGRKSIRIA